LGIAHPPIFCLRGWTTNRDQQNKMRTAIENHLFEVKGASSVDLGFEEMDTIMDRCLDITGRGTSCRTASAQFSSAIGNRLWSDVFVLGSWI